MKEGSHTVPDYYPRRAGIPCSDLSPDFESETIYCKDPEWMALGADDYVWSLEGRALADKAWIPDLHQVASIVELGDFVLLHPESRNDA